MGSRAYRGGGGRSQSAGGRRTPSGRRHQNGASKASPRSPDTGTIAAREKARGWMAWRGAIGEGSMGSPKRARPAPAEPTAAAATERGVARWLPLAAILGLMALAFAMGWHNFLSFKTIGLNYDLLKAFIEANLPLALAAFMLVYIAVIALSLPGGTLMTVTGGLLFGWKIAVPVTVVAATIGATIIFVVARSSFGDVFATRAGPW